MLYQFHPKNDRINLTLTSQILFLCEYLTRIPIALNRLELLRLWDPPLENVVRIREVGKMKMGKNLAI